MRRVIGFVGACLTAILLLMLLLGFAFPSPAERRALQVSAGVALVIQLAAFLVVRRMSERNVFAGWGLGAAIRFVAFVIWGFVGVTRLALPQTAALLAMATYLFVTTLIEPLYLKK